MVVFRAVDTGEYSTMMYATAVPYYSFNVSYCGWPPLVAPSYAHHQHNFVWRGNDGKYYRGLNHPASRQRLTREELRRRDADRHKAKKWERRFAKALAPDELHLLPAALERASKAVSEASPSLTKKKINAIIEVCRRKHVEATKATTKDSKSDILIAKYPPCPAQETGDDLDIIVTPAVNDDVGDAFVFDDYSPDTGPRQPPTKRLRRSPRHVAAVSEEAPACASCNKLRRDTYDKAIEKAAEKGGPARFRKRKVADLYICTNCAEEEVQRKKLEKKNKYLEEVFDNPLCTDGPKEEVIELDVSAFCLRHFGNDEAVTNWISSGNMKLLKLSCSRRDDYETVINERKGGVILDRIFGEHQNTYCRDDFDGLVAIFEKTKGQQGFIVVLDPKHNGGDAEELYRNEMAKEIGYFGRQGCAAGVMLPGDECKSLSEVTKKDTTLRIASAETGAALYVCYRNDHGAVIGPFGVYKDMKGTKLDKEEKKKMADELAVYRRILMREGICRIVAEGILDAVGIEPEGEEKDWLVFLKKLMQVDKLPFEDAILAWMTSTGEMRNHQRLALHEDGNKSKGYETLSLFGNKEGYLFCAGDDFMIKYRPGIDTIICNLHDVAHTSDERGKNNFSKVMGPSYTLKGRS